MVANSENFREKSGGKECLIHFFIFYFFNFPTPSYPLGPTRRNRWDFPVGAWGVQVGAGPRVTFMQVNPACPFNKYYLNYNYKYIQQDILHWEQVDASTGIFRWWGDPGNDRLQVGLAVQWQHLYVFNAATPDLPNLL